MINYIKQDRSFQKLAVDNALNMSDRCVYRALFAFNNDNGWQVKFKCSTRHLTVLSGASQNSVLRAKVRLAELGLITFTDIGQGRTATTEWHIIDLVGESKAKVKSARRSDRRDADQNSDRRSDHHDADPNFFAKSDGANMAQACNEIDVNVEQSWSDYGVISSKNPRCNKPRGVPNYNLTKPQPNLNSSLDSSVTLDPRAREIASESEKNSADKMTQPIEPTTSEVSTPIKENDSSISTTQPIESMKSEVNATSPNVEASSSEPTKSISTSSASIDADVKSNSTTQATPQDAKSDDVDESKLTPEERMLRKILRGAELHKKLVAQGIVKVIGTPNNPPKSKDKENDNEQPAQLDVSQRTNRDALANVEGNSPRADSTGGVDKTLDAGNDRLDKFAVDALCTEGGQQQAAKNPADDRGQPDRATRGISKAVEGTHAAAESLSAEPKTGASEPRAMTPRDISRDNRAVPSLFDNV